MNNPILNICISMKYVYSNFWIYVYRVLDAQFWMHVFQSKFEYMYFNACIHIYMCIYTSSQIWYMYFNPNLYTCISIQIWIYVFESKFEYLYFNACIHIYICVYIHLLEDLSHTHGENTQKTCCERKVWKYIFKFIHIYIYMHMCIFFLRRSSNFSWRKNAKNMLCAKVWIRILKCMYP